MTKWEEYLAAWEEFRNLPSWHGERRVVVAQRIGDIERELKAGGMRDPFAVMQECADI